MIAVPPGATIKEQLEDRGMSQKEFSARMDLSEKHVCHLINGDVKLTPDVAVRLESVLGIPARFWNNLESIYREKLTKINEENTMDEDSEILKKIPYNEMAKQGWIQSTKDKTEKIYNIRKFFEVVRLSQLDEPFMPRIIARKLSESEKSDYALLAWAQKAKLEARSCKTAPINIDRLNRYIPDFRKMTVQNPELFCPTLRNMLAECGIALIFLPHIGGSFLHGATFMDGQKIVVGLTVRGKDADKFWFSFFHELGHIILGHIGQQSLTSDEYETEADLFARNALIPDEDFYRFVDSHKLDKKSIITFAQQISIDVGIVVGRLQKEGYLKFSDYNDLKTQYILTA